MRLVDNWHRVARKAWSIRLAALLSGLESALPLLDGGVGLPHGIFAGLSGLVTGAALVARLVAQRSLSDATSRG